MKLLTILFTTMFLVGCPDTESATVQDSTDVTQTDASEATDAGDTSEATDAGDASEATDAGDASEATDAGDAARD